MEYQRPNVYWLEEPLPRYDYEQLAELNRLVAMPMAGGESNWGIHEFRGLLEQGCLDALMPEMQI
jgi:D-galactarolactone cycloisomerase